MTTPVFGYQLAGDGDGAPGTLTRAEGDRRELPPAAAVEYVRTAVAMLVVPDAIDFARVVALSGPTGVAALCNLAAADRLVCLATAGSALKDARLTPGLDAGDLVAAGRAALAELTAQATRAGVAPAPVAAFGPLGVFARTRVAVALGVASANGLGADPGLRDGAVRRLREIADQRFADLIKHPGAPDLFKGGTRAAPNRNGFRELRPADARRWLADQLAQVTDRLGLQLRAAGTPDGGLDIHLRNWPAPAVGTEPLAALADLQDAEALAYQLGGLADRAHPAYLVDGSLRSTRPDLPAYRRFRATGVLPPVFRPADGNVFVRVDLSDLPLAVLAARFERDGGTSPIAAAIRAGEQPGAWVSGQLGGAGVQALPPTCCALAARLVAAGCGAKALAVSLARLGGIAIRTRDAAVLGDVLVGRLPELAAHVRDPWVGALARHLGVAEGDFASAVGIANPVRESVWDVLFATGLAERLGGNPDHDRKAFAKATRSGVPARRQRVERQRLAAVVRNFGDRFRKPAVVVGLVGGVSLAANPAEVFGAVEIDTLVAVGEASFALAAGGLAVAGVTPDEALAEVPAGDASPERVARLAGVALHRVLGGLPYTPAAEAVEMW